MPGTIIRDVAIERNQFVRTVYFTGTKSVQISTAEMTDILEAASAVIVPYDVGKLKIKVSEVYVDSKSVAKVVWSAAQNDTAFAKGATVALPDGVEAFQHLDLVGVV